MTKILVIDDESSIRKTLRMNFEAKGFAVEEADSGATGITKARELQSQIVILDLGLPDMHGRDVLKEIRTWSKVPIIVLTATDDELIKVGLLDAGADDYITKPFSALELIARVHVALRHHQADSVVVPVFHSGDLVIDLMSKSVKVNNVVTHLTATEFHLLALLVKNAGQVLSQEKILKDVWGPTAVDNPHYLRIYIGQLRKKLEIAASSPKHILTEPGVGYKIV